MDKLLELILLELRSMNKNIKTIKTDVTIGMFIIILAILMGGCSVLLIPFAKF